MHSKPVTWEKHLLEFMVEINSRSSFLVDYILENRTWRICPWNFFYIRLEKRKILSGRLHFYISLKA